MMLEGFSLAVAVRSVRAGAEAAGMTFTEFVRRGMDPTSIAVMLEDSGAVAGLAIAGTARHEQLAGIWQCHALQWLIRPATEPHAGSGFCPCD